MAQSPAMGSCGKAQRDAESTKDRMRPAILGHKFFDAKGSRSTRNIPELSSGCTVLLIPKCPSKPPRAYPSWENNHCCRMRIIYQLNTSGTISNMNCTTVGHPACGVVAPLRANHVGSLYRPTSAKTLSALLYGGHSMIRRVAASMVDQKTLNN